MKTAIHALAATALLLAAATPVLAHANLDHATPAVGSQVETSPGQVKIWFSSEVDPAGTSVQVLDSADKPVDKKDFKIDDKDKKIVTLSLNPNLPDGTYKVVWKARGATDGHNTQGDFTFTVKAKK
jgi:methionine-rich copper-binding protein CopC